MKLYIQQKIFSLKDKFTVKDELGTEKYFIEGEFLSIGHKLHIKDTKGIEKALIREKVLTFLPKFTIVIENVVVAEIAKKFTFIKPKYEIKGIGWNIEGDFFGHDYTIMSDSSIVATIHKKWMSWGDSFEIDIANAVDEITALGVVLAIDCVLDSETHRNNHS